MAIVQGLFPDKQKDMYEEIEECDRETHYKKIGRFLEFFNVAEEEAQEPCSALYRVQSGFSKDFVRTHYCKEAWELRKEGFGVDAAIPRGAILRSDGLWAWRE